jgi:hypothetical protein
MTTRMLARRKASFSCKHVVALPPVIGEWQQACKQPQCSHYCQGGCCNPSRYSASGPCPFDDTVLPLEEVELS